MEKNEEKSDPRTEEQIDAHARGHDTMPEADPMPTGPSYNVMLADQKLANIRVESIRSGGESLDPEKVSAQKMKSAKEGDVVILGVTTPMYGGEDVLRSAIATRDPLELTLEPLDEKSSKISGLLRVNRLDHCGEVGGQRAFICQMESAEVSKDSEK